MGNPDTLDGLTWRPAALLLAAVLAVWANALWADFQFDDWADVVDNPAAQATQAWERLPRTVRPLLKLTYALQDWLHGPWPSRTTRRIPQRGVLARITITVE